MNSIKTVQDKLYLILEFFLVLLAIGMVTSTTLMTIADAGLLITWILFGYFSTNSVKGIFLQLKKYYLNKSCLVFSMIFFITLLGLTYSTDIQTCIAGVMVKTPLLLMPLIFPGLPKLKERTVNLVIGTFCAALLFASIYVIIAYSKNPYNYRNVYPFINTIILGFDFCFGVILLVYLYLKYKSKLNTTMKIGIITSIILFLVAIFIRKSLTGIGTLIVVALILLFTNKTIINTSRKGKQIAVALIIVFICICTGYYIYAHNKYYNCEIDLNNLPKMTVNGNPYTHNIEGSTLEEGNYDLCFVCIKELESEWQNVSGTKFAPYKYILIRYLNSLGYTKDSVGVHQLTEENISDIKHGIANVNYKRFGFYPRMSETFFSIERYKKNGCPSGSLIARVGAWVGGIEAIKRQPLFGYGTGDVIRTQRDVSSEIYPCLQVGTDKDELRHGILSHNQYVFFGIQSGIIGLILIIICFIYPGIREKKFSSYLWSSIFFSAIVSMFFDDMLGAQAGVTMITTFYFLFLFYNENQTACSQKQ